MVLNTVPQEKIYVRFTIRHAPQTCHYTKSGAVVKHQWMFICKMAFLRQVLLHSTAL